MLYWRRNFELSVSLKHHLKRRLKDHTDHMPLLFDTRKCIWRKRAARVGGVVLDR